MKRPASLTYTEAVTTERETTKRQNHRPQATGPGGPLRTRRYERDPANKVFHFRFGIERGDPANAWVKATADELEATTGAVVLAAIELLREKVDEGDIVLRGNGREVRAIQQ